MLQKKLLTESDLVIHDDYRWITKDRKELFAQCWHAGERMRAGILLVHGLGEHSSRYDEWSRNFARKGYSVLSFDLRGHGKTTGKPADTYNYSTIRNDISLLITKGRELFRNKPIFLYGHSLGGNLAAHYSIIRPATFDGLILTSPWLELSTPPPIHKFIMANILSQIAPWVKSPNGLRPEDISREIWEVHKYKKDPLIHDKISAGLFMKAYKNGLLIKRSIYKINVPLLIIHGSGDNITSFKASKEFVLNSGKKTTFVAIEGGYHELHNDNEKETVFNTILNWLNKELLHKNA